MAEIEKHRGSKAVAAVGDFVAGIEALRKVPALVAAIVR